MKTLQSVPMPFTTGAEACATASDAFFLEQYQAGSPEVLAATALCGRCPLVRPCLIWALDNPTLAYDGIWGATTPPQRRELRLGLLRRLGREGTARALRAEYEKTRAGMARLPRAA
ncbi:WhiB family transcriptional regulator [Streptomyces sp. YS415]|uniref:WhiB family transcriptional regulator n=1 Tax=Streptomyces sp. YS415 TaxID=2944806 RepID=UPI0020213DB8|nr:WhiB family transcriptional regulator [Streptomyces sp. YS415]MCL7430311.1 WhiB family transcriptional regulator [Streptomyces sp. YS415]